MDERRRSPRAVVDVPARLTVDGETIEGRVRDICRDAALVLADRSFPLKTRAVLEAELPSVPGTIRATGSIVRLAPPDQGVYGMALLFEDLPAEAALRIELFVSDAASV